MLNINPDGNFNVFNQKDKKLLITKSSECFNVLAINISLRKDCKNALDKFGSIFTKRKTAK